MAGVPCRSVYLEREEVELHPRRPHGRIAPSRPLSFWGDASENQTRRFELYSMDALLEHLLFAYFWD